MNLQLTLGWVFLFSQAMFAQGPLLSCPKDAEFVDHNQIDYTIKVKAVRGRVIYEGDGQAIVGACVALFDGTRSTLLRQVQADQNGRFTIEGISTGNYWLSVSDSQQALCPAASRLQVRRAALKSKIVVVMKTAAIDSCSYCRTE